jgi:HPt (histidine-containing phosphotransfer) domain-containing protein
MTSEVPVNRLTHGLPARCLATWSPPEMLQELAGLDCDLISELIQSFTADVAHRLEQIRAAMTQADFAMLRSQIHSIKGSSKQMAADRVASVCEQIEAAGGQWPKSQLVDLVRQLEVRFSEVREAMAWYQRTKSRGANHGV